MCVFCAASLFSLGDNRGLGGGRPPARREKTGFWAGGGGGVEIQFHATGWKKARFETAAPSQNPDQKKKFVDRQQYVAW